MVDPIPSLLPTTVIGSHAYPGWMWTALDEVEKGNYGRTDERELYDDAVNMAMLDQEKAGVDIISDGEMRRWYFVQSFYKHMKGIESEEPLRKVGLYGYDSPFRYHPVDKIIVPDGLGIVEEYLYLKSKTARPIKMACPGPLTISIHIRLKDKKVYSDRLELAYEFADVINAELKALVKEGADYIQIDEPSFAIIPGTIQDWVSLFNKTVDGVKARVALHICFGNLASRPRGKRSYAWMFPEIMDTNCEELVLEFANREMMELELCREIAQAKDVGAGIIDIKSFYRETPQDIAERIRHVLNYVDPEKLTINPDCGFFSLPRWLCVAKLKSMVKGTKLVRMELGLG